MSGYGSDQKNPQNAIPVYLGGSYPANQSASGYSQIKTGGGVCNGFNVNAGGTSSALSLYDGKSGTITVTIATPAVVTWTGSDLNAGDPVVFTNAGGALPTGITAGTTYYVSSLDLTADSFKIADTYAHAVAGTNSIDTSGSQSGVQTCWNEEVLIGTWATTSAGMNSLAGNGALFNLGLIAVSSDSGGAANLTIYYR